MAVFYSITKPRLIIECGIKQIGIIEQLQEIVAKTEVSSYLMGKY